MKYFRYLLAVLIVAVLVLAAWATPASYTGVLTDDMCTQKHMIAGVKDADCVRECVKGGAKYVVVTLGKTYVLTGDRKQFDKLAGQKVTVKGIVKGKTLAVASIGVAE